jgi:predicted peptidase
MKTGFYPVVWALILVVLAAGCSASGRRPRAGSDLFPQSLDVGGNSIRYLLYLPADYVHSSRLWPLLLFLHGAGERGDDLDKIKIHGPPKLIAAEGKQFPFVIVSPQCPQDGWWSDEDQIEMLDALLNRIAQQYRIDRHRIYVTGLSMGGFGTWSLAAKYPDRFAAIAPICGGGNTEDAGRLSNVPVWAFHGAKDPLVPVKRSQEMVDALKKIGGKVKFTIYAQAGHDSWTETYNNPQLYQWLLRHRRTDK